MVQFKLAPPNWLHNGKPDTPCLALIQLLCTPSLQTAFTYWQLCEIVGISSSQWRTCDWINSFWFEDWNCDIFKVRFGVSLDNVGWRWIIWWQDKRELSIPAELKKILTSPYSEWYHNRLSMAFTSIYYNLNASCIFVFFSTMPGVTTQAGLRRGSRETGWRAGSCSRTVSRLPAA